MAPASLPSSQELVEEVLARASSDGTVAIVHQSVEANVRFAANKLTTSGESTSTSLTVVSMKNGAYGTCRGDVTTKAQAVEVLRRAEEVAAASRKAPDAHDLVDAAEAASLRPSFDEPFAPADSLEFFEHVTPGIDTAFSTAKAAGLATFGFASYTQEHVCLGTSSGLRAGYSESQAHLGLTTKPEDHSRSVWAGQTARSLSDIDISAALEECRQLLGTTSRRVDMEPGKYTCVLSPSCVADMLLWMYWMMSHRDADEGKTVFSDRKKGGSRIGETIFPETVHLWSDPFQPGLECVPFVVTGASSSYESVFDNGFPLRKTSWVEKGTLEALVSTRQYAHSKGIPPAPIVANLHLAVGRDGPGVGAQVRPGGNFAAADPLLSSVERGLYITCLWYIRLVDPQTGLLTGLTRDGVFLIENGKIVAEVNNFRFNQSPVDMLASTVDASSACLATPREFDDVGCWVAAPALTVAEFNMSTVSEAL